MDLLKRLPSYIVNGLAAAIGVGFIHVLIATVAGPHAATLALSGAVCASLADQPLPASRTWRRVGAAAVGSVCAVALVEALRSHPVALGLGIAGITCVSMMAQAWGPRAGAVSFAPVLAVIFTMASPTGSEALLATTAWSAAGAGCYLAWAAGCAVALAPRYRRLALVEATEATAALIRARATLIETPGNEPAAALALVAWVDGETLLAERLQAARDFVFAQALATRRPAALLLQLIELRDALLASRVDLEWLDADTAGRWLLAQTAATLRHTAGRVDQAATLLIWGGPAHTSTPLDVDAAFAGAPFARDDPRGQLLPAMRVRARALDRSALQIIALAQTASSTRASTVEPALPLTAEQLQRFIAPEGWPLRVLRSQLRASSPVARHALRAALALSLAYWIGLWLPWASHPHWLVLSVAVVLRGNLQQTLSRRNARVLGTLFGCAVVLPMSVLHAPLLLSAVFLLALATAHAFLNRRYWLTATAATVMALLQAHAVDPSAGFALGERAADTVLGALLAWGFSYVLPSWERRRLPALLSNTLKNLNDYAAEALRWPPEDSVESRLARRRAYDALGDLAATLQRSRAEPKGVQLPLASVTALLDHGQRLMAQLSVLRMILARGAGTTAAGTTEADTTAADTTAADTWTPTLQDTRATLRGIFDLTLPFSVPLRSDETPTLALPVLPSEASESDLLPWLRHRLSALTRDAQRVRAATDELLQGR